MKDRAAVNLMTLLIVIGIILGVILIWEHVSVR